MKNWYLPYYVLLLSLKSGALYSQLNPDFGKNGIVFTIFSNGSNINAVAVQQDGKIVAAGSVGSNLLLIRFDTNGTIDYSFNADGPRPGVVTNSFGPKFSYADATALVIQSDQKILVAGSVGASSLNENLALSRYNTNGTLDMTFGGENGIPGLVLTTFAGGPSYASAIDLTNDGEIVVAGTVGNIFQGQPTLFAVGR